MFRVKSVSLALCGMLVGLASVVVGAILPGGDPARAQTAPAKPQTAWVKLCEKVKVKDANKTICLTTHERLDANTGKVIVSAAIRDVEGEPRSLLVVVSHGVGVAPNAGARLVIYTPAQWDRLNRKEKLDGVEPPPISLSFTLCHQNGCTAEKVISDEVLQQIRAGGGMTAFSINGEGKPLAFPIPLTGFSDTYAGPPVDNALYAEQRRKLMSAIAQRQDQLAGKTGAVPSGPTVAGMRRPCVERRAGSRGRGRRHRFRAPGWRWPR